MGKLKELFKRKRRVFEEEYELIEELGAGGFATVWRGRKRGSKGPDVAIRMCDLDVAIKCFAPNKIDVNKLRRDFRQAVEENGQDDNQHCMAIDDFFIEEEPLNQFILISKLLEGGDLFDKLSQHPLNGRFTEEETRKLAKNLMEAVAHLHKAGAIHRDIKPENLLYASPDSAPEDFTVVDYGCCLPYAEREHWYKGDIVGSLGYLSPEVLAGRSYNMLVDEWAAGILIYEVLTGVTPLIGDSYHELRKATLSAPIPYPPRYWKDYSLEAQDFVKRLLHKSPTQRMTAEEALHHPWITGTQSARKDRPELKLDTSNVDPAPTLRRGGRSTVTFMPDGRKEERDTGTRDKNQNTKAEFLSVLRQTTVRQSAVTSTNRAADEHVDDVSDADVNS